MKSKDENLICKECKEKYKNVDVLDREPMIVNEKVFRCKICGKWEECK